MSTVAQNIRALGVFPVLVMPDAACAVPLGGALLKGGMPIAEVTLRTPAALEAIRAMAGVAGLLVGAGTVLSSEQARAAIAAGAAFLVSPGLDEGVIATAREARVPVFPGVATATEVQRAWNLGLRTVKLFPAGVVGGPAAIKAFNAVFGDMQFVPTGGVSPDNLADYVSLPGVAACGGSWIASEKAITAEAYDEISKRAADAVAIVKRTRQP